MLPSKTSSERSQLNLKKGIQVIGLMSGTSLDGLDICAVDFAYDNKKWYYKVVCAESADYPAELKQQLAKAQQMSAFEYAYLDSEYGHFLGKRVKSFMRKYGLMPDFIASHGSTVFHQPEKHFTTQIGSGAAIAAETEVDTICDFRTTDVALGGQGAPLVPVGDRALFGDYDYCLNIGGFSNISWDGEDGVRHAYDISPVNYVLNRYMRAIGKEYDEDGKLAESGKCNENLLQQLNSLSYYSLSGPKSLGREWVEEEIFPMLDNFKDENGNPLSLPDKLSTFCHHAAYQVSRNVKSGRVLVTGGGAFNRFLLKLMRQYTPQAEYVLPDALTINFKEALIFAFLGALYVADMPNCMSSVTGAKFSCVGGAMYKGHRR